MEEKDPTFFEETLEILHKNNKTWADVKWVGTEEKHMALELFPVHANFTYNIGVGGVVINPEFIVVGDDWWLERNEHYNSEWWEFKTLPKKPEIDESSPQLLMEIYEVHPTLKVPDKQRRVYDPGSYNQDKYTTL